MGKILVIAEKPSAGADMAKVLGCTKRENGYIEGDAYIVTWAVGHLVGLKSPEEHDETLKAWKMETLPFCFPIQSSLKVLPATSAQFTVIKKLIHRADVDSIINAGDAGREGYLIQEWIYRLAGCKKPVEVLWASSLTEEALKKAFSNLHSRNEFKRLLMEAEARAEADWMLGMNYSRGLTLTKGSGKTLLRYGRCQISLLNLIVKREREIAQFKSVPYYEVWRVYSEGFSGVLLDQNGEVKTFDRKEDADAFISGDTVQYLMVKSYEKKRKHTEAPALYNLADLQKEMGSKYGYDAEKTLTIAQALYEKHKILSYPRTDSRVMSTDLAAEISKHLDSVFPILGDEMMASEIRKRIPQVQVNKRYVNDVKVADHHALVPTIHEKAADIYHNHLTEPEKLVFSAVVKRFLAVFLPEYLYDSTELIAETPGGYCYRSKGKTVVDLGWKRLYGEEKNEENEPKERIPETIKQGTALHSEQPVREDKMTQSPPRYTVSTIISLMEKYGIGTSATRADIIKKIMDAKSPYMTLDKGKYFASELGMVYVDMLPSELKQENLTAEFESKLTMIQNGQMEKDDFLKEIFDQITANLQKFAEGDEKINESLIPQKNQDGLKCPQCGNRIYKGKFSWYCGGYKNGCKTSVPLEVAHKVLTENQVKQLLEKGMTTTIKGFKKKDGSTFSAKLKLNEDNKVGFIW